MSAYEPNIDLHRRLDLVGLSASTYYYQSKGIDEETELLLRLLDQHYTQYPHEGKIKRAKWLTKQVGYAVGKKRVGTLMKQLGLETIYPKPNTSVSNKLHEVYPYLLKGAEIRRANQVWSADITYIPLRGGHVYLIAIIDWYSRFVLEWRLSISLEADFCVETLEKALLKGRCDIFNTDQGSQFTSSDWVKVLVAHQRVWRHIGRIVSFVK